MKLNIIVSDIMTQRRENNIVRLPKRGRTALHTDNGSAVELATTPLDLGVVHKIKQAYKKDISKAKQEGIPLSNVVFVSKNTATTIVGGRKIKQVHVDSNPRKCGIGSDPEYCLIDRDTGSIRRASVNMIGQTHNVGDDGMLLEIRPDAGIDANEHVNHMKSAILEIPECVDLDEFDVRGYTYKDRWTCGGHIHVGISNLLLSEMGDLNPIVYDVINMALVIGIGYPLEKLDIGFGNRRREAYGDPFEFRTNPCRLEFRTVSTKWTLYKDLAKETLKIAHTLTAELSMRIYESFRRELDSSRYARIGSINAMLEYVRAYLMQISNSEIPTINTMRGHFNDDNSPVIKVASDISKPFLTEMLGRRMIRRFMEFTENIDMNKLNLNVYHNWSDNTSITNTFK